MQFNDYQQATAETAIYPGVGTGNLAYPTLGLAGEAGEVAEKVKKILRDKGGIATQQDRLNIAKELGDVLWYVSRIAAELELSLDDIAEMNLAKLRDRQQRGKLGGSGDER